MFKKIFFSLIAFYTLLGFVVIPLVLKPQIISIVEAETNAKIAIENVSFNPYSFLLCLEGLKLSSLEDEELIYLKSVEVNVELYSLFSGAIHVKSFVLEEPKISLVLDKKKSINLLKILKPSEEKTKASTQATKIPRIILDRIAIVNGNVNYEDYSNKSKFEFGLDSIGFELRDIDTKNIEQRDANIRFHMTLADGGFIDLKSKVVSVEPFVLKGTFGYEASKLYTQWRYVKDKLHLEVADGKLSLDTEYYFNLEDLPATTLSNLNISLDNLRVKPKGEARDVLTLKSLYVRNATIKPLAQFVRVKRIALKSLQVKASRDEKGMIDWLDYIKVEAQAESKVVENQEKTQKMSPPWDVQVSDISLENIKLDFKDEGVRPNVVTTLNELNIYAQAVTLAGKEPFKYQMDLRLNDELKCNLKGSVIHNVLDITTAIKCKNFDVEHYLPYIDEVAKKELKVYDVKLRSLVAGFDVNATLKDVNKTIVVDVSEANVNLNKFAINQKSTNKRLATFSSFDMNGITLNTATKEVMVRDTSLKYLHLRTARLKNGSLSLENLLVPKASKAKKTSKKKEKSFRVQLKKVSLKGAKVTFEDKLLSPSVKAKIDKIYFTAKNIDSKKYSWMNYYMSARVNNGGKIKSSGAIRHTPLKQKGKFELQRISLKEITPYLQEKAYVSLEDGYVSLKTQTRYANSKDKADLSVKGSFKLEDFFVNDTRDTSALMSFSKIDLKEFTLETSPNRLFVNEVDVDTFYVNAMIDANKTMNFAQLMKEGSDAKASEDSNQTVESEPFPVKITKINVKNGSASFSDASLPIHFKTNIHNLNGDIYSVSTSMHETSYIDLVGDIDEYGSTKLKGGVKSANPKAFTDLAFNFRNLDLSAMSGYSATFAGYEIDDGKLFLNLNYDIKDSQLLGENSIIVKNIKLGKEVDIEGGSLPLGFVIALLEDSDGIIDIDMPIRGNVDEPDFKYGALAWKTFGNLILKAVTSPFRFLGSMLGIGGDDLEYAEFEGGSSVILPSEREKLDNVAKLMIKRPKILLSIGGGYNQEIDKEALQKAKLIALVVKKSGAKNEKEQVNAMTADLLEDIYEDAKDDDTLSKLEDALEKKYKNEIEFNQAYLLALIELCSGIQVVSLEEIQSLAHTRAVILKEYLVDTKGVEVERVKMVDIVESTSDEKQLIRAKLEVVVK